MAIGPEEVAGIAGERARRRGELLAFLAANEVVCPRCGYGLRGLTGVQCPECGWVFDAVELRRQVEGPVERARLPRGVRWLTIALAGGVTVLSVAEVGSGAVGVGEVAALVLNAGAVVLALRWFAAGERAGVWEGWQTLGRLGIVWGLVVGAGVVGTV